MKKQSKSKPVALNITGLGGGNVFDVLMARKRELEANPPPPPTPEQQAETDRLVAELSKYPGFMKITF